MALAESCPAVGTQAQITGPSSDPVGVKVLVADDGQVTTTRPATWTDREGATPPVGSELLLTWHRPRGVHQLPCRLEAVGVALVVVPTGPVWLLQRRDRVRIPVTLPAAMTIGARPGTCDVLVVGLSEEGARIACDRQVAELIDVGMSNLIVEFSIDHTPLRIPARVVREAFPIDGGRIYGLVLATNDQQANVIRSFIMAWQRQVVAQGVAL